MIVTGNRLTMMLCGGSLGSRPSTTDPSSMKFGSGTASVALFTLCACGVMNCTPSPCANFSMRKAACNSGP